jgi:hypothetical protein
MGSISDLHIMAKKNQFDIPPSIGWDDEAETICREMFPFKYKKRNRKEE